jgi:acyl-CoA synthetase (AMP-forming)/AMP-acid ligase II
LTDYLKVNAKNHAGKPAIIFESDQISWADLYEKVEAGSRYFAGQLGGSEQKVVALLMTNSIEFVQVYLSVLHAGHIAMPLDPVYKRLEIDAMINRVKPAVIVIQDRYKDLVGAHEIPVLLAAGIFDKKWPEAPRLRLPPAEQVASLTFTSGTSGQPKVVPNTHQNHIWNIEACSKVWDWTKDDTLLVTLPLSHMHGIVICLSGALYHGNTMYLRQQSFDAKAVLEELSSGRISLFTQGPIAYIKMLAQTGDYDLSGVRLMISGSAPFPPSLWQEFKDRFGIEVVETYGTSETGRIAANSLDEQVLGSPGRPLPGVDLQLSPDGEVQIKSGGVFPGYYKNAAATRQSRTADGYWRTGDIAEIRDGNVFLKGRVQERIRRFGYTLSPRDVEWALLENPKIKEAFVMGKQKQDRPNDELYYFIAGDITDDEINNYCKANLPFSWRPDHIIFVKNLPRTENGKPHVKRLKEMAA